MAVDNRHYLCNKSIVNNYQNAPHAFVQISKKITRCAGFRHLAQRRLKKMQIYTIINIDDYNGSAHR